MTEDNWISIRVPKEFPEEVSRLHKEIQRALGYDGVMKKEAYKILMKKNRKFRLTPTEIKEALKSK